MATRTRTPEALKRRLRSAFRRYLGVDHATAGDLLRRVQLQDKAYELVALIDVMTKLKNARPSLNFSLQSGTSFVFRAKGGPIDRGKWPYISVHEGSETIAELWVDIEFISISAGRSAKLATGRLYGRCHELDVVLVPPNTSNRPLPEELLLGVEAKHREFNKSLLKELLGVRREMMLLSGDPLAHPPKYWFVWWANDLHAFPPSGLIAYCSSQTINNYAAPADFWGIRMEYLPS